MLPKFLVDIRNLETYNGEHLKEESIGASLQFSVKVNTTHDIPLSPHSFVNTNTYFLTHTLASHTRPHRFRQTTNTLAFLVIKQKV